MSPASASYKVLLVEDDPMLAGLIVAIVADVPLLHLAAHVSSVAEARAWLEENVVDVVLLDYDLPDGTAADLTAWMRSADRQVPVLLSTGRERASELAASIGASGGVRKDGNWASVMERLLQLAAPLRAATDDAQVAWPRNLVQCSQSVATAVHEHTLLALDGPADAELLGEWVVRLASAADEVDAAVEGHRGLIQEAVALRRAGGPA